ncbi:unnamed protein product, partial [Closterium sp. NIES-65]
YAPSNAITGSIPSTIAALSRLEYLVLSLNPFLTGSLPRALSRLTRLQHLLLGNTAISGRLPRFLAALTRLTVLELIGTKVQGKIPAAFGALTNLVTFQFPNSGVGCPMEGRCEINQDRSSMFCRLCSTFCSTCIPIN